MQDIFSVHPFGDLRATPENWLDSSIDSTVLEEISSGLSVLREEEEDVLEFEIGSSSLTFSTVLRVDAFVSRQVLMVYAFCQGTRRAERRRVVLRLG